MHTSRWPWVATPPSQPPISYRSGLATDQVPPDAVASQSSPCINHSPHQGLARHNSRGGVAATEWVLGSGCPNPCRTPNVGPEWPGHRSDAPGCCGTTNIIQYQRLGGAFQKQDGYFKSLHTTSSHYRYLKPLVVIITVFCFYFCLISIILIYSLGALTPRTTRLSQRPCLG